jgi:uncharacterized protein (TIGR02118 family)
MIHWRYFITRRADLSREEFFTYWRKRHPNAVSEPIAQIKRYVQSHGLLDPPGDSPYDGIAELWTESPEDLQSLLRSPQMAALINDELNFIDHAHVEYLTTRDIVVLDGARTPNMVKGVWPNKRKAGMSVGEYRRYWAQVHAPMALQLPGLRRYERSETLDELYQWAEPRWDGVAQLWFDDVEAAHRFLQSDEFTHGTWADGEKFVSAVDTFWAREHLLIWPR